MSSILSILLISCPIIDIVIIIHTQIIRIGQGVSSLNHQPSKSAFPATGADLLNETIAGKFDGYSEAWSKSTFEVKSIKELMQLTEEYEEK